MDFPGNRTRELPAFDLVHPAVQLGCFASIVVLTMATVHPVFLTISFTAAFLFSVYLRGWTAALRTLAWQVPLVALIALINPLFAAMGSTELFRIGTKAVYWESVAFGICMGGMLVAAMTWFANAARVLTSDKVMAVLGGGAPTVALLVSMAMRLVPRFVARGKHIENTAQACSIARPTTVKDKAAGRIRLVSVLMSWSMEDSLETADAMRARGWGAKARRTSYRRYRFRRFDALVSTALALLVGGAAALTWEAWSHFRFYPTMDALEFWWGYLPYAVLMFLPLAVCLIDDARWRRVR